MRIRYWSSDVCSSDLLAARFQFERRRLPLSSGERAGGPRLRHLAKLSQPAHGALPGNAKVEDASRDREDIEGRQARLLWRARDQRRRLSVGAEARLSGRRADRRYRGIPERSADQGNAYRDEIGYGGGRGGVCGGGRWSRR